MGSWLHLITKVPIRLLVLVSGKLLPLNSSSPSDARNHLTKLYSKCLFTLVLCGLLMTFFSESYLLCPLRITTAPGSAYTLRKKVLPSTYFGASVCHKYMTLFSTWKDQMVSGITMTCILGSSWTKDMSVMVLACTDWSFQVLKAVPYLWQAEAPKKVLGHTFCS